MDVIEFEFEESDHCDSGGLTAEDSAPSAKIEIIGIECASDTSAACAPEVRPLEIEYECDWKLEVRNAYPVPGTGSEPRPENTLCSVAEPSLGFEYVLMATMNACDECDAYARVWTHFLYWLSCL